MITLLSLLTKAGTASPRVFKAEAARTELDGLSLLNLSFASNFCDEITRFPDSHRDNNQNLDHGG
jgi:hypothetical protein